MVPIFGTINYFIFDVDWHLPTWFMILHSNSIERILFAEIFSVSDIQVEGGVEDDLFLLFVFSVLSVSHLQFVVWFEGPGEHKLF